MDITNVSRVQTLVQELRSPQLDKAQFSLFVLSAALLNPLPLKIHCFLFRREMALYAYSKQRRKQRVKGWILGQGCQFLGQDNRTIIQSWFLCAHTTKAVRSRQHTEIDSLSRSDAIAQLWPGFHSGRIRVQLAWQGSLGLNNLHVHKQNHWLFPSRDWRPISSEYRVSNLPFNAQPLYYTQSMRVILEFWCFFWRLLMDVVRMHSGPL